MNKRCFIFGNSPTILKEDLKSIADEDIFIVNRGYKIKSYVDFKFTNMKYYVLSDKKHAKIYIHEIQSHTKEMIKYVCSTIQPGDQKQLHGEIRLFNRSDETEFNRWPESFEQGWAWPKTVVTDAVMIAYFLGYTEIYLLGVDLDYSNASGNYFYPASQHDIKMRNNIPNSIDHILSTLTKVSEGLFNRNVKIANLSKQFKHKDVMPTSTLELVNNS